MEVLFLKDEQVLCDKTWTHTTEFISCNLENTILIVNWFKCNRNPMSKHWAIKKLTLNENISLYFFDEFWPNQLYYPLGFEKNCSCYFINCSLFKYGYCWQAKAGNEHFERPVKI